MHIHIYIFSWVLIYLITHIYTLHTLQAHDHEYLCRLCIHCKHMSSYLYTLHTSCTLQAQELHNNMGGVQAKIPLKQANSDILLGWKGFAGCNLPMAYSKGKLCIPSPLTLISFSHQAQQQLVLWPQILQNY